MGGLFGGGGKPAPIQYTPPPAPAPEPKDTLDEAARRKRSRSGAVGKTILSEGNLREEAGSRKKTLLGA